MKYSVIVPVFNRPDEVAELLESLTVQSFTDFEVIIVEDGSKEPCETVCKRYEKQLDIKYFMKENSGPGQSRNYGAAPSMRNCNANRPMLSAVRTEHMSRLPTHRRPYPTP